ncbi:MAG: DUF1735 domain-containing protein [Dysgonamonadaceae bacterium]|nr:DUF1735 domain-containing protein [Dysgonamonadaceae bacterium]
MKKYIKIQYFLLAILSGASLTSCLTGEPVWETDGGPMGILELDLASRTGQTVYATRTYTLEVQDVFEIPVTVNLTGFDGAAEDIQVTLAINNDAVLEYNTAHKGTFTPVTADLYELPASNVVTIPKGEKKATYVIKLKTKLFDLTKSYALGVQIVSATAGTISGNYSTGIYSLPVKSPWEGTYNVHYQWVTRGGVTPPASDVEYDVTGVKLTTVGPGVVQAQYVGYWFSGWTQYTLKGDGTVGVAAYSGSTLACTVVSSSQDVDNLTFTIEWTFVSPSSYRLIETYVRTGD